jgi:acyl carrier protein
MIDDVKKFIKNFVSEELEIKADWNAPHAEKQSLFEDLGIDSIELLELTAALQEKFGVNFKNLPQDQLIRNLESVESIAGFVVKQAAAV